MENNQVLDEKIKNFNRANGVIPRYKIIISGRDFDDVFTVDTDNIDRAVHETKLLVISSRNLTLIESCFLRVQSQILPLS